MSLEGLGALSAPLARPNRRGMTPGSNPYLFVVGAACSSTTLLQRMLDAHPLLAVVNETYWLPRKYRERTPRAARLEDPARRTRQCGDRGRGR